MCGNRLPYMLECIITGHGGLIAVEQMMPQPVRIGHIGRYINSDNLSLVARVHDNRRGEGTIQGIECKRLPFQIDIPEAAVGNGNRACTRIENIRPPFQVRRKQAARTDAAVDRVVDGQAVQNIITARRPVPD